MTTRPSWTHVPARADLDAARDTLQDWLRERRPDCDGLRVAVLEPPTTTGGTGDNLLLVAEYGTGSGMRELRLVVRLAPDRSGTVHGADLGQHFRILRALWPTPVPSPEPLWLESDERVLGVPFMVMTRAAGRAAPDFPIYNAEGFLADAPVAYRAAAWEAAIGALAQVAVVDPASFAFLDRPDRGGTGLEQVLGYVREAYDAACGVAGGHHGVDRLLEWLDRTPAPSILPGLSWGDARMGNVLIDDAAHVTALLDWDRAMLGGPLVDLGWWLLFDRMHAEDYGAPRLAGLGTREQTLSLWSTQSGLSATGIEWYEILAATLLSAVRLRNQRMRAEQGLWAPDADNPRSAEHLIGRAHRMVAAY